MNAICRSFTHFVPSAQIFLLALGVVFSSKNIAADLPTLMRTAKPAVFAVGTFQPLRNPAFRTSASGFIVGDGTLYVTNAHAIPASFDSAAKETIAIARAKGAGGQDFEVFPAEVVRMDRADDLALLRIKTDAPLPALKLAPIGSRVEEGGEVAMIGFPIGSALGLIPTMHRGIVAAHAPLSVPKVTSGQIDARTIRRMRGEGETFFYQLDAIAYPGNSGSPLFSTTTGEVVGIINATYAKSTREAISLPSGISYAVPVAALHRLLDGIIK